MSNSSRAIIATLLSLGVLLLAAVTVAYADHATGPTDMRLKDNKKFHYLDQTLFGGVISTTEVPAANYTILIDNEDKIKHIVEFEKVAGGSDVGTEYETGMIPKGANNVPLLVALTAGTWKVYCPLHQKAGMVFYLEVTN